MATTVGHEPHVWRPLYVASITLTTLGILSICLRLYASLQRTSGGLKWDLVWCILSSLFAIASVGPLHVAINNGMGLHITQVTYPEIVTLIEYNEIASTLGLFSITFAKFSIIALLLEVQGSLIKYRAYVLYFVAVVLGLSTVITLSATWTQCRPVQKTWDLLLPGTCPGKNLSILMMISNGAINIAADVFLSFYPITIMWGMSMRFRVKASVCVLMAGGILATFACVMRTVLTKAVFHDSDPIHTLGVFDIYCTLELWLVIILGSLPASRSLLYKWLMGTSSNGGGLQASFNIWIASSAKTTSVV